MAPTSKVRESIIHQGVRFLQHPTVQSRTLSDRIHFLEKKGLTPTEISEVLKKVKNAIEVAASIYDEALSANVKKTDMEIRKLAKASATSAMAGERLKDRVIFIAGGAQGIGEIVAMRVLKEGAKIVVFDESLTSSKFSLTEKNDFFVDGNNVLQIQADVTKWEEIDKAIQRTVEKFGRLDVFITCLHSTQAQHVNTLLDATEKEWDEINRCNARSIFLGCKRAIQQMLTQEISNDVRGKIINITTHNGVLPSKGHFADSINNAAIVSMSKYIAKEYSNDNIICNSITAGVIDETGVSNKDLGVKVLYGRLGRSLDIANAAVYLGSDEASFIQATNFVVDGGMMGHL